MSNSERNRRLSLEDQSRLAFEGLLDEVEPSVLDLMITASDNQVLASGGEVEGCYFSLDPEEPDNVLATSVHINPERVAVKFGPDSPVYVLGREAVAGMIEERRAENPPAAHPEAS